MNTTAMSLPRSALLGEVEQRIARKAAAHEGAARIPLTGYMENIGWPELFGFRMAQYFDDPAFTIEQFLRQQIWWADNVNDETQPSLTVPADVGMYWDMTLFGQTVTHTDVGVPGFPAHPFRETPDLELLGQFDFATTGEMPRLLAKYEQMLTINARDYDGGLQITFPSFHRGPLDIYVQMRGYEGFINDLVERPEFVQAALLHLVDERWRFAQARAAYLGKPLPDTTFVADDWVNLPFITPTFFREMVVPVYAHLRAREGPVTGFHTCGRLEAVTPDLLAVFPEMDWIDVSGWNDLCLLDAAVDPRIRFHVSIINTVSLSDAVEEQRGLLRQIAAVGQRRSVSVCAQAIVKLCPTYDETLARLNRFLALARKAL